MMAVMMGYGWVVKMVALMAVKWEPPLVAVWAAERAVLLAEL